MDYRTMPGIDRSIQKQDWSVAAPKACVTANPQAFAVLLRITESTFMILQHAKNETILAEALKGIKDEVVIATRFGYDIHANHSGQNEPSQRWKQEFIRKACEKTHETLIKVETMDIFQWHYPRLEAIQTEKMIETLECLREKGRKVETWISSNHL